MGLDVSNRWHFNKGSFMIGYNFQRDLETKTTSPIYVGGYRTKEGAHHHYQRNMHSIFGQLAYNITEKDEADFNFRETWTEDDSAGNGYDKFTPEVTWTHSFNEDASLYAKAGKSFMMPTFTQLYGGGNIVGVPDLKPKREIIMKWDSRKILVIPPGGLMSSTTRLRIILMPILPNGPQ